MRIKVRAKRTCYYDLKRRKPGQVFEIDSMKEFSKEGMTLLSEKDKKPQASAQPARKSKVKPLEEEVLNEEVEDEDQEFSDNESTSDRDVI